MDDNVIELRVVYEDLPDLVEVATQVRSGRWSAYATAYVSLREFEAHGRQLLEWAKSPDAPLRMEAGADTGIGWLVLVFYTIERAGHVRCAVTLATGKQPDTARPEETRRFAVELATELGLVEQFAREWIMLSSDFSKVARLTCLPS